jgi:hypothetical protein
LSREVAQFLLESELVGILLACGFVTLWILEPAQAICQPDRLAILLDRDLEPLLAHRVYEAIAVHHEDLEFVHELDHAMLSSLIDPYPSLSVAGVTRLAMLCAAQSKGTDPEIGQ